MFLLVRGRSKIFGLFRFDSLTFCLSDTSLIIVMDLSGGYIVGLVKDNRQLVSWEY